MSDTAERIKYLETQRDDLIKAARQNHVGEVQGFIDQFGQFLTREEAHVIAKKNGQIVKRCGGDEKTLYSENLY
tara:strand:+ start:384 stop:605 length:222 start_codon:yes stop_codon:yes gene_type:complete